MVFQDLMNDDATLRKKTGQTYSFKASVQTTKSFTDDARLPVEEGDLIERKLPNGMTETYTVLERGFRAGLDGIPDHYQMKVSKKGTVGKSMDSRAPESISTTHQGLLVFISHSSKDAELALALVELLKAGLGLFANQIRCSSVDGYRLPVGVNTESQLREEVNDVKVVIGLVTPNSLSSSFVMFELGARWGANLFLAPLLAGIKPGELSGPLSLLNALSAHNEAQLHQLLHDLSERLGLTLQNTASYVRHVSAVRALADQIRIGVMTRPEIALPPKTDLKMSISCEGTPPSQVVKIVANQSITVSRLEYLLSNDACIVGEDVSLQGETLEVPLNHDSLTRLWNSPRPDKNQYDHSGPAKIGVTVSCEGKTKQYIFSVSMENFILNNIMYRKIVGSKTFYG